MENSKQIENLTADKAKQLIAEKKPSEIMVVDVRQPEEYRSGHIPGAIFIPLPELPGRAIELDPAKAIILYCRSGNRSRAAATLLLNEGFSMLFNLVGGITAWNEQIATGSYDQGLVLLEGRETTEELVSLAVSLEEGSRTFYTTMSALTSDKEAQQIFNSLAADEARHKARVYEAYKLISGKDVHDEILKQESLSGVMESGVKIDEVISFIKERDSTLLDVLEISMQVETNALDLYVKISREISDADAKKVFEILIDEEQQHLAKLGKLLGSKAA